MDATSDTTFAEDVLHRSHEHFVLVDFWAPWCGPCRMLSPVLEKLAPEYEGRVTFLKLNTDENPATARRYKVSGIPDVRLFRHGEVVDGFVGAQPEAQIRMLLEKHAPSPANALARSALDQALQGGAHRAGAIDAALAALAQAPGHPQAQLALSLASLSQGHVDNAAQAAKQVTSRAEQYDAAQAVLQLCELVADVTGPAGATSGVRAGGPIDATALAESQAASATARQDAAHPAAADSPAAAAQAEFARGYRELANGDYDACMAAWLGSVEASPTWEQAKAKRALVALMVALGPHHPAVPAARRKLAILT